MQTMGLRNGRAVPMARRSIPAVPVRPGSIRRPLVVVNSGLANPPSSSNGANEEGLQGGAAFNPGFMEVPSAFGQGTRIQPTMNGNMGSFGGGGMSALMERGRRDFVMPSPPAPTPKLDDGGSGGDIGKIIHNGGGGGGGDDDDDDFFQGGDDEGDGDGSGDQHQNAFFRQVIPESYDKLSIGAVFAEWMRTIQDLPHILRQAVQMGLFSSAQLVRFFAMDVRPSITRTVSRCLPPTLARDFVGRLMADPGFVQKMVMESAFSVLASLWYEYRARGDKFKDELDLVLINTLGMAAATGAVVWLVAPSRSYGSIQKFPWQQMLDSLPNCVFDASGPLRQYTQQARAAGFFAKMAELSAVGLLTGLTTSLAASAATAVRKKSNPEWEPSVAVPDIGRSTGGLAAYFALNANVRYQLMGGLDQVLFGRARFLWTYMLLSGGARVLSNQVGELSRPWWQGLPSPSTLATPQLLPTMPRRVKKKVSKKVPRVREEPALAQAAAAVVAGEAAMQLGEGSALQQPFEQAAGEGGVSTSYTQAAVAAEVSAEGMQGQAYAAQAAAPQSTSVEGAHISSVSTPEAMAVPQQLPVSQMQLAEAAEEQAASPSAAPQLVAARQ